MAARRAGGQGVGARTGDERPNLLAMRCALPAVVALLLLLPLRSRAADERPAGPNCGLTAPPPEAGEDYKRGATLRIHPRAKDIGAAYTGCQIVWAPAAQGWSVVAIVAIENGQPIRSWSPDGTGHEPCRYEQGRLAAGSATTCPDARALIAKSLAPGCVAKRLQAVQEKGFGAPAPSGCDHE